MGASSTTGGLDGAASGPLRRAADSLASRPVLTTFIVGCLSCGYQIWWVARNRHLGGFGVDESAFLTDAFRFHRALTEEGVTELARVVLDNSRNAPLMPLTAVPFMMLFGASTTSALVAQSAFYLVGAVAVAAIVRKLSSGTASLVAGLVALGVPVMIMGARYVHLSVPVTAFLCLAVLALLSSRRGEDRLRMFLFGCAIGAMVMSRTMAVAFVPGLILGSVVVVRHSRRVAANALLAAAGLFIVAAPWWLRQFDDVSEYLLSFGYGSGAGEIAGVPLLLRPAVRAGLTMTDVRPLLLVPALIVCGAAVVSLTRWRANTGSLSGWMPGGRGVAAISVIVGVGFVTLLTSSNMGSWFQMPLEVLAIAVICPLGANLRGTVPRFATALALVAVTLNLALVSAWRPGSTVPVGGATLSVLLFGGTEDAQALDFEAVEPRFAPSTGWEDRASAESEWAAVTAAVAAAAEEFGPDDGVMVQSLFGENRLLRSSTLALTEEISDVGRSAVDQPARPEGLSGETDLFAPRVGGVPRILIFVRSPYYLYDEPLDPLDWVTEARSRGWEDVRRIPLPDGGQVVMLTHPDNG